MKHKIIYLITLIALLYPLYAQNAISAYPYMAYSSETKLMGGAFSFFRYELDREEPAESSRDISVLANTIYSQKHQFLFVIIPQYRTENWKLSSSMTFQDWPDTFYGTGNATLDSAAEDYTSRRYAAETVLSRDLPRNLDLSLRLTQGWHEVRKSSVGSALQSSELLGLEPGFYSGVGYGLAYDSSDEGYYPEKGVKLEWRQLFYDAAFGSDYDYSEAQYDLRVYQKISPISVLAFQSDLIMHHGDLPFFNYPELGKRLRAYDSKRYIDKARISQRIESRIFPFNGGFTRRLGFVLFAETGQVAANVPDIRLKDWHTSLGGGLRFSILPKEKLNLRADIGFGKGSVNFIVNAREVF
ncbi:MAG: outer membrane protein assembly factor [Candidatus Cloacimonetes bacterium]|nr:outer membrane protein assembly factor [Candidatus Cloacimonadota bacterium]